MQLLQYPEPSFGTDVIVVCPSEWTSLQRANAICQIQWNHPMDWLATLTVAHFCGDLKVSAEALLAGWAPGL